MTIVIKTAAAIVAGAMVCSGALHAEEPGDRVARAAQQALQAGGCVKAVIEEIGPRLQGQGFNTGIYIGYSNGSMSVSYSDDFVARESKPGDVVNMCLLQMARTSDGKPCPANYRVGSLWRVENLRTGGRWTMPDWPHYCNGA
jgi:hypothetical protein